MIIYHQNNFAAFSGNHVVYWVLQQPQNRISITSAFVPPTETLLDYMRGYSRGFNTGYGRGVG